MSESRESRAVPIKKTMSAYVAVYVPARSYFKQWSPVYTSQGGERAFRQIQKELETSSFEDDPALVVAVDPAHRLSVLRILHHLYTHVETIGNAEAALYISSLKILCDFPYFLLVGETEHKFRPEHVNMAATVQQMVTRNLERYPKIKRYRA
jgi:hypothetical protein